MVKVLNKSSIPQDLTSGDMVYIGRPSKWGNPFYMGRDGTRFEVIMKYRSWIQEQPELMAALDELRGKYLVCFCAPAACHGDVLLQLANKQEHHEGCITEHHGESCGVMGD